MTSPISNDRRSTFTNDELDAMHRDDSTSAILNKARHDAGYKDPDVAVRGDSRSLDQTMEHQRTHLAIGETIVAATHATEVGDILSGGKVLHFLGAHAAKQLEWSLPAAAWVAGQVGMYEMEHKKLETKDAATRDQMRAAMLDKLQLPSGYRDKEIAALGVSMTNQSAAVKIENQLALTDKALLATLQLHCDRGMTAARDMLGAAQTKEAFLKSHPAIAARYAEDAAFHDGFEALVWAKSTSPAAYAETTAALESRDARYAQASVSYRL